MMADVHFNFDLLSFIMRKFILMVWAALLFSSTCFSQSSSIHFRSELAKFDSTVSGKPADGRQILENLHLRIDFKANDTLLPSFFRRWGTYYQFSNHLDSSIYFYEKGYNSAIALKLYSEAAASYHNKAEAMSMQNRIDSAIEYESLAIKYANLEKNISLKISAQISLAQKLRFVGKYRQSNQILFQMVNTIPEHDIEIKGIVLSTIAMNYDDLEILEPAEKYYLQAIDCFKLAKNGRLTSNTIANLVDLYNGKGQYQTALTYSDSIIFFSHSNSSQIFYHIRKANTFKYLQKFDSALIHIQNALIIDKKTGDDYGYTLDLILSGQIYREKGDFENAFIVLSKARELFTQNKIDYLLMEKQLYRDYIYCFLKVRNPTLANDFNHFQEITDSLTNQSIDKNLAELETKYNSQQKEIQIARQKLEIENQKNHRNIYLSGAFFLFLLSTGGFLWYRNKNQKKALLIQNNVLQLKQNLTQIEITQLNQQLDPHEIKNLLAGISPEIQEKAPDAYRKMLKLLNVIKASLNNTGITEPAGAQVEQIEDYLSLMQITLSSPMNYKIRNELPAGTELPRLILKNLVENSVKHGIKGNPGGGDITVHLSHDQHTIRIVVDDTGKGRQKTTSPGTGIGISTYTKLFAALNEKNKNKASLHFVDKEKGTTVVVTIPDNYVYG